MFWTSAFLLGLVGSLHCGVMCGPIALAISSQKSTYEIGFIMRQLIYNLGRVMTYLVIGGFIGLIGAGLSLSNFQQSLSIISGLSILLIYFIPKFSGKSRGFNFLINNFTKFLRKQIGPLFKSQNYFSRLIIGFINGFLPCGLVYVAAAGALATGEPISAAIFMFFFGLGTIPMIFGISLSQAFLRKRIKFNPSKTIPIFVVTISALFILRGMNLGIPYLSPMIEREKQETSISECVDY